MYHTVIINMARCARAWQHRIIQTIAIVLTVATAQAQDAGKMIVLNGVAVNQVNWLAYDPPVVIRPLYRDLIEAANQTPEELMTSVYSASSQTWVNYNTLGGSLASEKYALEILGSRQGRDPEKNYLVLNGRLSFTANGASMALVRYRTYANGALQPGAAVVVLQQAGDRWYQTFATFAVRLANAWQYIDASRVGQLLAGKPVGDKNTDALIKTMHAAGVADLDKLILEVERWVASKDKKTLAAWNEPVTAPATAAPLADPAALVGTDIPVSLSTGLVEPQFASYQQKDKAPTVINIRSYPAPQTPEATLADLYKANNTRELTRVFRGAMNNFIPGYLYNKADTLRNHLELVHTLQFRYQGELTCIVKYYEIKDSVNVGPRTVVLKEQDGYWQPVNLQALQHIVYVVLSLKTFAFWEFYNTSKSRYPVVQALRAQVRDKQGVLDINKLGQVLRANRSGLGDVCDF